MPWWLGGSIEMPRRAEARPTGKTHGQKERAAKAALPEHPAGMDYSRPSNSSMVVFVVELVAPAAARAAEGVVFALSYTRFSSRFW